MKKKYDAIIIGGGPGGLSIASLLAREGLTSVILEKTSYLGGRYRSVDFEGSRVDNCIHLPTGMVTSPEETYMYKFLSYMGLSVEPKVVEWKMGICSTLVISPSFITKIPRSMVCWQASPANPKQRMLVIQFTIARALSERRFTMMSIVI